MKKFILLGCVATALATGISRGQGTDFFYSVQSGNWHSSETWTSLFARADFPGLNDAVHVFHSVTVETDTACAELNVQTATVEIAEGGTLQVSGTSRLAGATLRGSGTWSHSGLTTFHGAPSRIQSFFINDGVVHIEDTTSLRLENIFYNNIGKTTTVIGADFDLQGTGVVQNAGTFGFAGSTDNTLRVQVNFINNGETLIENTSTLQIENTFYNGSGATTTVTGSGCTLQGTGFVKNAGTFWFAGSTGSIFLAKANTFQIQDGMLMMGTSTTFRSQGGALRPNSNATFRLESGSSYVPSWGNATSWYDGTVIAAGPGRWQMETGTLMVSHFSKTTTVFNVEGGFDWYGGTWNVRPEGTMENLGTMRFASTSTPLTL